MKGVILAGGKGGRLWPATRAMNKHMIPVLAQPMILYPLRTLTEVFGIRDILIVSGGGHIGAFADFLGDGSEWGVSLTYRVQKDAGGVAQALLLAREFAGNSPVAVVLGDNIFDGAGLEREKGEWDTHTARVFIKDVGEDARRFGVPTFDRAGAMVAITEKPTVPASSYAVTGLYLFPPDVFAKAETLSPSARGELEIADVLGLYLAERRLSHTVVGCFWSDAGTPESLAKAVAWAAQQAGH